MLKVKNAIIGYAALRHLDVAAWVTNGRKLSKTEQVDIAHLYSRQFEHSYTNFEKYSEKFMSMRCYGYSSLRRMMVWVIKINKKYKKRQLSIKKG